jgi:hypothetical protein
MLFIGSFCAVATVSLGGNGRYVLAAIAAVPAIICLVLLRRSISAEYKGGPGSDRDDT